LHNDQAHDVEDAFHAFEDSEEGHALGNELDDLFQTLDDEVEVSDIPEHWEVDEYAMSTLM